MSILQYTKEKSADLADYLEVLAKSTLRFEGNDPLIHSSPNHIHLWKLEYLAERYNWIDSEYKIDFINYILRQWKIRLKGLAPYHEKGYRVYVYEDLSPSISVVAETEVGFPYDSSNAVFTKNISNIIDIYNDKIWSNNFSGIDWKITHDNVLKVIEKNKGSISKPSAHELNLQVGKLRHLIINMSLGDEVNTIRKKYKRRPADFSHDPVHDYKWYIYEQKLPANYS